MPKVKVKVPQMSGFDKSFKNLLTSKVGTLTPLMCDEVIPNTKVHLKVAVNASLPPLASDTFMRCNLKLEAFFVPTRLLYGGFTDWISSGEVYSFSAGEMVDAGIPLLTFDSGKEGLGSGSLADYLGFRAAKGTPGPEPYLPFNVNIFPFLAYHRVYDDWYRNPLVQQPIFVKPSYYSSEDAGILSTTLSSLPFITCGVDDPLLFSHDSEFADGVSIVSLRQRNFGYDYFTTALPNPQLGEAQKVTIALPAGADSTSFTIAALRGANSLQQFAERNEMAGPRYQDFCRANYGADLSSGVAQRSIILGSGEVPVYSKGIYMNNNLDSGTTVPNRNPFYDTVGAEYGSASCVGEVELIEDFTAQECGYIFVMASLVPVPTYSTGIHNSLLRYTSQDSQVDMANPILQNVGFEPITKAELTSFGATSTPDLSAFGYVQRFAGYKARYDELHGLLRDGSSLSSFALQRSLEGSPTISSEFLAIPTDFLDQVSAVADTISNYGVWIDSYLDYKVAMPLAEFSIPSLQDPAYEHGRDVSIEIGGSKL